MSIEELVQQGSIHRFGATHGEIKKAIRIARRDLTLAEKLLEEN
jgi:transcriptional regulator of nitric oxide reductase